MMKSDIAVCKSMGCDGIVTGVLDRQGNIDWDRNCYLVEWAYPMGVTFHRAFDAARDPFEALRIIKEAGFERILTSGQMPTAAQGAPLIASIVAHAEGDIIIMPGSGVRSENLPDLHQQTRAEEFHSSARRYKAAPDVFGPEWMKEEMKYTVTDPEEVARMAAQLRDMEE